MEAGGSGLKDLSMLSEHRIETRAAHALICRKREREAAAFQRGAHERFTQDVELWLARHFHAEWGILSRADRLCLGSPEPTRINIQLGMPWERRHVKWEDDTVGSGQPVLH